MKESFKAGDFFQFERFERILVFFRASLLVKRFFVKQHAAHLRLFAYAGIPEAFRTIFAILHLSSL